MSLKKNLFLLAHDWNLDIKNFNSGTEISVSLIKPLNISYQ